MGVGVPSRASWKWSTAAQENRTHVDSSPPYTSSVKQKVCYTQAVKACGLETTPDQGLSEEPNGAGRARVAGTEEDCADLTTDDV
ncbi:hypothetical protein H920_12034 [Fukomys damarensis]|uniref:Uncharacterized protein n=1 Tax=Fukomys damarensis TaxID=885580 RepID=A0A091D8Q9_FUKDA|nr:hypothetical protein H920_12034 [Fukomys damarensis]